MSLKSYEVPGPDGQTLTVQLDEETADRLGLKSAPAPKNKQADPPKNKQVTPDNTK